MLAIDMNYIKKTEFEHMQGVRQPVLEVCPKTGKYIAETRIPKKLSINHFFKKYKHLPTPIHRYRSLGVNKLTNKQVEEVYILMKEFKSCKIV
jgi:hypothetical protein